MVVSPVPEYRITLCFMCCVRRCDRAGLNGDWTEAAAHELCGNCDFTTVAFPFLDSHCNGWRRGQADCKAAVRKESLGGLQKACKSSGPSSSEEGGPTYRGGAAAKTPGGLMELLSLITYRCCRGGDALMLIVWFFSSQTHKTSLPLIVFIQMR